MIESKTLTTTLASIENKSFPSLDVSLINHPNISAGEYVPRSDTREAPQISAESLTTDKKYLLACLDLDAPLISFSFLAPILHWLQPGVDLKNGSVSYSEDAIATWHPAGPPPGAAPHRYVFLLYEQPTTFDAAKYRKAEGYGLGDRIRYRWDNFEKENALGRPIAANYFTSN